MLVNVISYELKGTLEQQVIQSKKQWHSQEVWSVFILMHSLFICISNMLKPILISYLFVLVPKKQCIVPQYFLLKKSYSRIFDLGALFSAFVCL